MTFIIGLIIKFGLVGILIGGVFAGHKYLKFKDDNLVEEVVEQIVENELGIKIDMTPDSQEPIDSSPIVKEVSKFLSDQVDKI